MPCVRSVATAQPRLRHPQQELGSRGAQGEQSPAAREPLLPSASYRGPNLPRLPKAEVLPLLSSAVLAMHLLCIRRETLKSSPLLHQLNIYGFFLKHFPLEGHKRHGFLQVFLSFLLSLCSLVRLAQKQQLG